MCLVEGGRGSKVKELVDTFGVKWRVGFPDSWEHGPKAPANKRCEFLRLSNLCNFDRYVN